MDFDNSMAIRKFYEIWIIDYVALHGHDLLHHSKRPLVIQMCKNAEKQK